MRFPYIVAVVAVSQIGATDCGQVIKDPGFDLWCGDSLCAWKLERGDITRVPTWHEGDSGVSLDGSDTAIEQLASFNGGDGDCIVFDLVANVEDGAEVYLNVDVQGDGVLEMHERLPTSHWKPLSYAIAFKRPFDGVRFELAKTGSGAAVLAQIGATTSDKCEGLTPLDPGPRKNGASCDSGADCVSGICKPSPTPVNQWATQVCMGCDPAQQTCGGGETCGLVEPVAPIYAIPVACEPPHGREVGELCLGNDDCASQICNHEISSQYGYCGGCGILGCPTGQTCQQPWSIDTGFGPQPFGPWTCSNGKPGDTCAADADCTSARCTGSVRKQCGDGRACATRDDCPDASGLTPGACTTVGIQGGRCE